MDFFVADDEEAAAGEAARVLAEAAAAGETIVLTGGSTPRRAYQVAAARHPDWSGASVWWGDERCVPPDDERSNFGMAKAALLDRLTSAPASVERIRGELEPEDAAAEYDAKLEGVRLDLVLLGLGPDGHAASLFPYAPSLEARERRVVAARAQLEPFVDRVTLTIPTLCSASRIVWLVTGSAKAEAARRAFAGSPDPATPASLIRSGTGGDSVILDREAARQLAL